MLRGIGYGIAIVGLVAFISVSTPLLWILGRVYPDGKFTEGSHE